MTNRPTNNHNASRTATPRFFTISEIANSGRRRSDWLRRILPPTVTFDVVWRAAIKSEHLRPRRGLIKRLCAATRPSAINKSTWSRPRRLVKLVLLTLLEWELRLQKTVPFKSFAAAAKMHQKRMGRELP
jgi:hypothetical protein